MAIGYKFVARLMTQRAAVFFSDSRQETPGKYPI